MLKPEGAGKYELVGEDPIAQDGITTLYVAVDNHPAGPSDPRAGDVYVVNFNTAEFKAIKPNAEGLLEGQGEEVPHLGSFHGNAGGVAVDSATGNVYVTAAEEHAVDVFDDEGGELPLLAITGAGTPAGAASFEPIGIAVDSADELIFVVDRANEVVDEFSMAGTWLGQLKHAAGGASLREPLGVAVQEHAGPGRGDVYVLDGREQAVDVFGAANVVLPTVAASSASGVTQKTATLNGTVNPSGVPVTACQLEYRTSEEATFTHSAACSPAPGSGSTAVPVSLALNGLPPAMTYRYRVMASDANGTNYSPESAFTTLPAVQGVSTGPAEAVTASAAKLAGSLAPEGTDAHYYFQYGTSKSYGSTSPALPGVDAGTGGPGCEPPGGPKCAPVAAEAQLGSLAANTRYHYRLVAVDEFGTTTGEDREFKTLGPPRIRAQAEVSSSGRAGQTAATLQAQIDPDGSETTYRFEYGETTSYGTSVPVPDGHIASGEEFVSVPAAELTGLKTGTTYHYRVLATNLYGTTTGPDEQFATTTAALVEPSVSDVTATSATLKAEINPLGFATTYYFQYGATADYSTSVPAPPGVDVGSGESPLAVSVHLQGLAPGATYHYRVVAINEPNGTPVSTVTPDETFATQAGGAEVTQPDGRQWEMVSPPDKQGAGINPIGFEQGADIQAAANGDGIAYTATDSFVANPAANRSIEPTPVISLRDAPGVWSSSDITTRDDEGSTPPTLGHFAEYRLFSPDLSLGLLVPPDATPLPPLPAGAERTLYLRGASGEYKALVTSANVPPGTKIDRITGEGLRGQEEAFSLIQFDGASPDLSHIVLSAETTLTSTPPPLEGHPLYEWAGGQLQAAGILPNGEAAGAALGYGDRVVRHAVSDDGSRLIWTSNAGHLYLRDITKGETVQVDAAQGAPEPKGAQDVYRTANGEGSRVFFTSSNRLTFDSTAGPGEDLYVFEVTSGSGERLAGRLTDLTVDENEGENAEVKNAIGASEDGSYVYFIGNGVLGDAAEHGASGGDNLYLERYDEASKTWMAPKFIAALSEGDSNSWGGGEGRENLEQMTSRVSPNGRFLAFMSQRSLTGYDNHDANSGVADEEVYLYDASTGRLACASCNPTGGKPVGLLLSGGYEANLVDYPGLWKGRWLAANIPGWTNDAGGSALYQSRYLSDSGRLFFNSSDALVPADVNGKEDVYEYEPAGVGSCQGATHGQSASVVFDEGIGGCVGLISSGTSSEESAFMDASETGEDVFFLTLSKLSSSDYDTSLDVYDAHECTAAAPCAASPPLAPPPCATGDACKPSPTPQPALFGAPSSETFSGAGNVTPASSGVVKKSAVRLKANEKLGRALKLCKGDKRKKRRVACEKSAHRKYGAKPTSSKRSKGRK